MIQILFVPLLVCGPSFAMGDEVVSHDNCATPGTCQSSLEDSEQVSLLSIKTQLSRGKQELSGEGTDAQERSSCATPKCNPDVCGKDYPTLPGIVPGVKGSSGQSEEVDSLYCLHAYGNGDRKCCMETYEDDLTKVVIHQSDSFFNGAVSSAEDACKSCQLLSTIARPVELTVMRHAEGCHNLKSNGDKHTHAFNFQLGTNYYDAPLTQDGIDDAYLAQTYLAAKAVGHFDAIVTSPMRRAMQTLSAAITGIAYLEAMRAKVVPYAQEIGGSLDMGPENKPTSPAFQACIMRKDNNVQTSDGTAIHWCNIDRCNSFGSIDTCQDANKYYSTEAKLTSPQDFYDFLTLQYPGQKVLLAGHSNWAKMAGLMKVYKDKEAGTEGEKIGWASLYEVTLIPGGQIQSVMEGAHMIYEGTSKTQEQRSTEAENGGSVQDSARCAADKERWETCDAERKASGGVVSRPSIKGF